MIASLAAFTIVALASATHTDTTFAVKPGTRLELNSFAGSIAVQTWSKNAVRVSADHSSRVAIEIEGTGPSLSIKAAHWRGIPSTVEYQLTVPRWMALELSGVNTDISVDNSAGEIQISSVQGEVSVSGGTKIVNANSVEGEVRISRASGKIECSSVNADVRVEESRGQVLASSVNGEIVLNGVDSDDVEASTVNGGVTYEGTIKDGGSYRFSTHNGEVAVTVPQRANATVSVATFSGEFSSSFPVQLTETRHGRRFNFTLGNGSARLELESFQGEIRLRRPGDPEVKQGYQYRYEYKKTKETVKSKEKKPGDEDGEP